MENPTILQAVQKKYNSPNQKQSAYDAFSSATARGDEMASALSDFARNQMAMTPQDYRNLYSQFQNSPAANASINNAQARNSNAMAASGLSGSNLANYESERMRQQIGNQYSQQNFGNYMSMLNSGVGTANSLAQLGYNSGNSLVSGMQNDERLAFQKQQYEDQQNSFWGSTLGGLVKGGVNMLGGALLGPVGSYMSNRITDSLYSNNPRYEMGMGGQYQRAGTNNALNSMIGALG